MVLSCHHTWRPLSKASICNIPLYQQIYTSSDTGTYREDARIISSATRRIYAAATRTCTFDHASIGYITNCNNSSNSNRPHLFCC